MFDAMLWFLAYCLSCYTIFPVFIMTLRYMLYRVDKLTPEFETVLDALSSQWRLAPALVPLALWDLIVGIFTYKK
jgi:hypothetical protein